MKLIKCTSLFFAILSAFNCQSSSQGNLATPAELALGRMPEEEARQIGRLIWHNESRSSLAGLTGWNAGEEFASMGIAHFIWYPAGAPRPYRETFPEFLRYAASAGAQAPGWISENQACPWPNRQAFQQSFHSPEMQGLRAFLSASIDLQTRFILRRLQRALPEMLEQADLQERTHLIQQYNRLVLQPGGRYALADYVNFKGEGIYSGETYRGQGWGLRQVLQEMRGTASGQIALSDFVYAARSVLYRRIQHAPPGRNEERFWQGWSMRLNTYLDYEALALDGTAAQRSRAGED